MPLFVVFVCLTIKLQRYSNVLWYLSVAVESSHCIFREESSDNGEPKIYVSAMLAPLWLMEFIFLLGTLLFACLTMKQ